MKSKDYLLKILVLELPTLPKKLKSDKEIYNVAKHIYSTRDYKKGPNPKEKEAFELLAKHATYSRTHPHLYDISTLNYIWEILSRKSYYDVNEHNLSCSKKEKSQDIIDNYEYMSTSLTSGKPSYIIFTGKGFGMMFFLFLSLFKRSWDPQKQVNPEEYSHAG